LSWFAPATPAPASFFISEFTDGGYADIQQAMLPVNVVRDFLSLRPDALSNGRRDRLAVYQFVEDGLLFLAVFRCVIG
jgi:hypothetical protein